MSPDNGEVYIMQDTDEEWVAPTPVSEAITEALAAATDLDETDLQDTEYDIDRTRLRELLDSEGTARTFTIQGHDVTITADGEITVEN